MLLSLPTAAYLGQRGLTLAELPHTTAQCHLTILGKAVLFFKTIHHFEHQRLYLSAVVYSALFLYHFLQWGFCQLHLSVQFFISDLLCPSYSQNLPVAFSFKEQNSAFAAFCNCPCFTTVQHCTEHTCLQNAKLCFQSDRLTFPNLVQGLQVLPLPLQFRLLFSLNSAGHMSCCFKGRKIFPHFPAQFHLCISYSIFAY